MKQPLSGKLVVIVDAVVVLVLLYPSSLEGL